MLLEKISYIDDVSFREVFNRFTPLNSWYLGKVPSENVAIPPNETYAIINTQPSKFFDVNKFDELEKDTNCLYLAPPERDWLIVSDLKSKESGNDCGRNIAMTVSLLMHPEVFSSDMLRQAQNHGMMERGLFTEEFRCIEM